jgi:hypothetical protein
MFDREIHLKLVCSEYRLILTRKLGIRSVHAVLLDFSAVVESDAAVW